MIKSKKSFQPAGPWVFLTVWLGQVISFIGSGLTSFALGMHVHQTTGSITRFALN